MRRCSVLAILTYRSTLRWLRECAWPDVRSLRNSFPDKSVRNPNLIFLES